MLTQRQEMVHFDVTESQVIGVEYVTRVYDGETRIAQSDVLRSTFEPGCDLTAAPAEVQHYAALAWTPDVLAAYQALNVPALKPA